MKASTAGHGEWTSQKHAILTGDLSKLDPKKITQKQMVEAVDVALEKLFALVERHHDSMVISFQDEELQLSPSLHEIILRNSSKDREQCLRIANYMLNPVRDKTYLPYAQYSDGKCSDIRAYNQRSQTETYFDYKTGFYHHQEPIRAFTQKEPVVDQKVCNFNLPEK